MNRQRFLLPALLLLTVARVLFLPIHPLSDMEHYSVECSQHSGLWQPALGPVLPFLIKLTTSLFGVNALGVRILAPLLILGASWMLWELARGLFDANTASWSVVIFQVTPVVNVAATTMTLTTLGLACSVVVLAALRHALHREYKYHLQWWMLGSSLVLAVLIDWRLFMLGVSCIAGMALTQRGRRALLKWPVLPVLASCAGLALTLFYAWNSEHGWPAFMHFPGMQPPGLAQLTLHVLLALGPLMLAAYGWSLVESVIRRPMEYPVAFLYAFAWPLVSLDVLSWMVFPWPQCGLGAWIAPTSILLAYLTMSYRKAPAQLIIWLRRGLMLSAGVQVCAMMLGDLQHWLGFAW